MPKIEEISSDEEDDIWEYKSQTQKARKLQNDVDSKKFSVNKSQNKSQISKHSARSGSSLSQKQIKTEDDASVNIKRKKATEKKRTKLKVKVEVKPECTPNAKQTVDRSGRCPVCQMPFLLLSFIETPSWHVDQCLDVPYSSKNECPKGLECDSEFPNHYKKFRHQAIARSQRKNDITNQKGNVEGAKTKLSFDGKKEDTKLVVPGTSSDCIIILDSDQDSNFSQRSNHDVEDEDLPSPKDKTGVELRCYDKDNVTALGNDDNVYKSKVFNNIDLEGGPKNKKSKENGFDKNKNLVNSLDAHEDSENDLFGTNSEDEGKLMEVDYENDNANLEEIYMFQGSVNVSDDSCGSVQDIDALIDETRSVSDMLNDAGDDADSDHREIYHDNMHLNRNKAFENTKTNVFGSKSQGEEDTAMDTKQMGDNHGRDVDDEKESDDDLISLFTDRDERKASVKSSKDSTISGLKKMSENFSDSDSGSDLEILKTTLTQPLFTENDFKDKTDTEELFGENDSKDKTYTDVNLEEDSPLMYAASHKTPVKHFSNAETNQHVGNKETKASNHIIGNDIPKKGFFATKMLQNASKARSDNKFKNQPSERKDYKHSFGESSLDTDQPIEECVTKTVQKTLNDYSEITAKSSHLKRKATYPNDIDNVLQNSPLSGKFKNLTNIDAADIDVPEQKTDTEEKLIPFKVESIKTETIDQKPKMEKMLKPKTPIKRKKGRKDQKEIVAFMKKESSKVYPKLESFFKPKRGSKGIKEPVFIQTDSESSSDCERFNKVGKFVRCCEKCTEENSCKVKCSTIGNKTNVFNSGDNNSRGLDSERVKVNRTSNSSSECSRDLWDNDSDFFSKAASCKDMKDSQNSTKLTISENCQNYSQFQENKTQLEKFIKNLNKSCSQQNKDISCSHQNQDMRCSNQNQGTTCSHQNQSKRCSIQNINQNCSSQNKDQRCSDQSQCQSFSNQSLGQSSSHKSNLQTSSCHSHSFSSKGQGQIYFNKSQCHCGSPHCLHINSFSSQNNNSNGSCSQNTLQFNIENVCTLSQNTYSNLGGGFIPTIEEDTSNPVSHGLSENDSDLPSTMSSNMRSSASTSSSMSEMEEESILQIRKSATEILMASSRLLYKKSVKNAFAARERQSSVESSAETGDQRKRGWNRNRGSTTSTETSEDAKEVTRKCPFYKKIPDTCMTVDAFKYGNIPDCKVYILSHFHYDHYMGLTKQFKNPIYCSKITGNLVKKKIGVDSQYIHNIPLNTPTVVENVEITFLEANHCPGAVLILFKLKTGKVFLHTGDFRASQDMENYPQLQNVKIHSLYLDTTYCDPQYDFAPQEEVIKFTVKLVLDTLTNNPKTLVVCGTYTIGKERIFTAIAEELDCRICVMRDKKNVLDCMEDEGLKRRISLNWEDSGLHVVPMNRINYHGLQEHLLLNGKKYNSVLGIEPTGWTHNKKVLSLHHIKPKVNKDNIKIYGVPYSEHSSFLELKRFVQFTRPVKILPTVNNGNVHSRRKMEVIFEAWMQDAHSGKPSCTKQSSISGWAK